MDQIKDAFQKVKQDMDSMKKEIDSLREFLSENNKKVEEMDKIVKEIQSNLVKILSNAPLSIPTDDAKNPTYPTDNPAHKQPLEALKGQNIPTSTGNEGVPTDKQTNRQTNQQTEKTYFGNALEILDSLDNIKKEIRNKFKRITDQEFLVFSTIYQMTEETGYADYKSISQKLSLTESSIRDYVGRLVKKGIPVEKTKINNKMIQLSISEKLKKIAPLPVIFQLRQI